MVAYNAESTISLALSSLLSQTYKNWQCLVIDDASTDGTAALLSAVAEPRLIVQRAPHRLGRGGARNLALQQATGAYLASLDADDFLFPHALEAQVKELEQDASLSACTGSLLLFGPDYCPLGRRRTQLGSGRYRIKLPLTTRVPLGSTMIRRELVGQERFNEALGRSEDRDFFDRVLRGGFIKVLARPTYAYRWCLELENVMEGLRNREVLFRRRLVSSPLRAASQIAWTRMKRLCYPALHHWGWWGGINRWRIVQPSSEEVFLFEKTLKTLRAQEGLLFR